MVETFPNAPITEALIDIRAQLSDDVNVSNLENLHKQIEREYPTKRPRKKWEGTFELKEGKEPPAQSRDLGVDGFFFRTADEKQVVQYRLDGFTFSRLRPYTAWKTVSEEAKRLWDIYKRGVKLDFVTRLALRYINSIEIPSKDFELEEYLSEPPKIPQGLPQLFDNFFTRLEIPFPDRGAKAVVMQTPSSKKDPVATIIILDIDVFAEGQISPDSPRLWEIFRNLREIKNEIFFNSLTEKTKVLFR